MAYGRSAALFIMLLAHGAGAQMNAVAPMGGSDQLPGLTGVADKLYLSSEAAEPTASATAAAPVTLPPPPRRARTLQNPEAGDRVRPFRAAAFGLTASTLGAGAEMAVRIARTLNLRVGGSYLNWTYPFNLDGIDYAPALKFTAGQSTIDWFPHHAEFHISVGALYFRNHIAGNATVAEGQSFTLGATQYTNSVDDPVGGTASVVYGKQIAPLLLLGFGNLLPRAGRHISVPVEFGGAYLQAPQLNLHLTGTACTTQGCFNAATDTEVQANLKSEITKLQGDLHFLQIFPIVSVGLACRF